MNRRHSPSGFRCSDHHDRRGFVLMWIIIAIPAIVFLFAAIVDLSRVWIARIELTNAMEAAALSAVKTWGEAGIGGNTPAVRVDARNDAVIAAAANTIVGQLSGSPASASIVVLQSNGGGGLPNNNLSAVPTPTADLFLGRLTPTGPGYTFISNQAPTANDEFGVRAQKTVRIYSIWNLLFGVALGPYDIQAGGVAIYDAQPRIVRVVAYVP